LFTSRLQELVHDLLHTRSLFGYRARGKGLGNQRPKPCVVGRIEVQHARVLSIIRPPLHIRKAMMVEQDSLGILISCQYPTAGKSAVVHGVLVPQPFVVRVRVGPDRVAAQVKSDARLQPLPGKENCHGYSLQCPSNHVVRDRHHSDVPSTVLQLRQIPTFLIVMRTSATSPAESCSRPASDSYASRNLCDPVAVP